METFILFLLQITDTIEDRKKISLKKKKKKDRKEMNFKSIFGDGLVLLYSST